MDKHEPISKKPEAPATDMPRRRGYSGRGAASALETLKKLEQAQPKRDETTHRLWA